MKGFECISPNNENLTCKIQRDENNTIYPTYSIQVYFSYDKPPREDYESLAFTEYPMTDNEPYEMKLTTDSKPIIKKHYEYYLLKIIATSALGNHTDYILVNLFDNGKCCPWEQASDADRTRFSFSCPVKPSPVLRLHNATTTTDSAIIKWEIPLDPGLRRGAAAKRSFNVHPLTFS